MRVVITGATGLIGKALCDGHSSSYEIAALSRNPQKAQAIIGNKVKVVLVDKIAAGGSGQRRLRPIAIPALVLRLAFGIMADEILLSGQCVMPNRLLKTGFTFAHPGINEALEFLLGKGKK